MNLHEKALDLLTKLIAVPSFSREEDGTASLIQSFFENEGVAVQRSGNNILVRNKHFTH